MKQRKNPITKIGIASKLTIVFILFAMLLILSLAIPIYNNSRIAMQSAITSELLSTAIEKQAALDNWVNERLGDIVTISQHSELVAEIERLVDDQSLTEPAPVLRIEILSHLYLHAGTGKKFNELMFLAADSGQVLISTNPAAEGTFKEDQPFYFNGKNGPFIQTLYFSLALQTPAMAVSAPIHSANGRLLGVLVGMLKLAEMEAIVNRRTGLHQSDDSFLVTASNLFATQPRLIPDLAVLQIGIHTEAVKNCLLHSSGVIEAADYRGIPATIVYRWLPSQKLCLIVKIDQVEALAPVRALFKTMALVGGLVLFIAAIAAFIISRSFTRPIQNLVLGTEEMGKGNLDYRIGLKSQDEIGQLGKSFDRMAENLKKTLVSRDDLVKEVKERKKAEEKGRQLNRDLEKRVKDRTAQLTASNAELEAFAYSVSHDLRAPLRAMDGFSTALKNSYPDKLDVQGKHYLTRIQAASREMGQLIEDLLNLSRVTRSELKQQAIDLSGMARAIAAGLITQFPERQVEFDISDKMNINGDANLFKIVLENLINNAFKFTSTRARALIEVGTEEQKGRQVYYVRDNGVGFDMAYANKLFVPFQRLHAKQEFPGTGIGLVTVKRIVTRHGGRIWADAVVDQGAAFYFTIGGK
jgi:signal transduction histidine kinase